MAVRGRCVTNASHLPRRDQRGPGSEQPALSLLPWFRWPSLGVATRGGGVVLTVHRFSFLVSCRGVHGVGLVRSGEADHLAWWRVLPCFSQELRRGSPLLSVWNKAETYVKKGGKKGGGSLPESARMGMAAGELSHALPLQSSSISLILGTFTVGRSIVQTWTHRHLCSRN